MAVHPIDYRYGSTEMRSLFEEKSLHAKKLAVEAALAKVLAEKGIIPKEAAAAIEEKADPENVSLERVKELEEETKHDIMALVKALTEVCGEAGKYVHLTATSYDIVDTAQALVLKDALEIVIRKSKLLLGELLDLAEKHKGVVMVGRTHGQHAIPITLGFKLANYADKLGEDVVRLEDDKKKYVVGKFSGAVGTYAAQKLLGLNENVEKGVMEKLGIKPANISMQTVPRENLARIVCDMAVLAGTIEQMAKEVRNLQRTEIGEISEGFGKGQVGSSTMAQKKNPINTENICSNVKIIRSCVGPVLENIALEHERDLTNSAAERSLLPTVFILMDEVLERSRKVFSNIVISEENIKRNLELSKGTLMSERVITELVKRGMGRQDAHELLRESSMKALSGNMSMKDVLLESKAMRFLKPEELDVLLDYKTYTGLSEKKVEDVRKNWGRISARMHKGSSKNTIIYSSATPTGYGKGEFEFLDYFSVFDWGRFLDSPIKGKALAYAALSKRMFEMLQQAGIPTHYERMSGNGMGIKVVNIPETYKNLPQGARNFLLPIEIIFRVYTHPQSSDLRKIKDGGRTWQELGYESMPEPNKKLPRVKISYSTKLEPEDRVLTKEEARVLSGLTPEEMEELEALARNVSDIITADAAAAGMEHYDGKIEVARGLDGRFMVIDVVGGLDEHRFMINIGDGRYVDWSKQLIRNIFIVNGWKAKTSAAKKLAREKGEQNWIQFCEKPPKLDKNIVRLIEEMYLADAKARGGVDLSKEVGFKIRSVKEVAEDMWNLELSMKM